MIAVKTRAVTRLVQSALAVLVAIQIAPTAQAAGPLDFGYAVDGPPSIRPVLVFNDGTDTYVQPAQGVPTVVKGAIPDGPYLRAPGLPDTLKVKAGRYSLTVNHVAAPSAPGAPMAPAPVMPISRAASLNAMTSNPSLGPVAARPMAPPPLLRPIQVPAAPAGATAAGLVAEPVTNSANASAVDAIEKAAMDIAARDAAGGSVAPATATSANSSQNAAVSGTQQGSSLLARSFGATAIRDSDTCHTQIRFAAKPAKELVFTSAEGRSLNPVWDTTSNVVTIDRVDRFNVSDGGATVEVARVASSAFDFDLENAAHLVGVFSKDGATYFKFGAAASHVSVVDVNHAGTGRQKGHYYKFDGIADQFIVTANGKSINVTRKNEVTYYDRAAKQS